MTQVREAIQSLDEDLDHHLMDWLLYYVYSRSEHVDRMEYKVLITMLDEAIKKDRVAGAGKKRPESSSKPQGPVKLDSSDHSDDSDRYSDDNFKTQKDMLMESSEVRDKLAHSDEYEDSPRVRSNQPKDDDY